MVQRNERVCIEGGRAEMKNKKECDHIIARQGDFIVTLKDIEECQSIESMKIQCFNFCPICGVNLYEGDEVTGDEGKEEE